MAGLFSALTSSSPATVPQGGGGLLDLILGAQNPVSQFADNRQNVLGAIGAGLASGPTFAAGLANAAQNIPQARQRDYQTSLYKGSVSQTVAFLQKKYPQLAQAVQSGATSPSDAMQQAFSLDNRPPVVMAPGSYLANGTTGAPLNGGQAPGGFYGSDLKSQAWNTVLKGQADPSQRNTDQYRAAWAIVTEPTMTPQGMMTPNVPSQWAPDASAAPASGPATAQAAPAGYGGGPSSAMPASGAPTPTSAAVGDMGGVSPIPPPVNVQPGPGIIPGTQPFNESKARSTDLASMAVPDLATAIANYPALTNPKDQALQAISGIDPTGIAHGLQSPAYQRAYSATRASISNILYTVSGAAIGDKELERKIQDLTPQIGDKPPVVSDKLNRLANYVVSIANSTQDPQTIARAQQALQGISAAQAKINGGGAAAAQPSPPTQTKTLNGQTYFQDQNGDWYQQ